MKDKIYTYFDVLNQHSIISATNIKGQIKYVNDKFCKISKYTEGELLGAPHSIVNSGFHDKKFFIDLWKTISKGEVWQGDILNKAKDGSNYWVGSTIVPILEGGKIKEYFSIRIEKTLQKKLQNVTKFQEKRYSQLFDHISDGVIVLTNIDGEYIIDDFNRGAEKLDFHDKTDVIGKSFVDIFAGTDMKSFTEYINEAFETGYSSFPVLRYQDEKMDSWRKGTFYKLTDSKVVCVYQNITEEINQLEQLKKYNEKLEEIAFKASHEVRAPVASILGLMQLIDFKDLSKNNQIALEHMKSAVETLDHTVREMVKVSYDTEEGKELFAKLSDLKDHYHHNSSLKS
jgi:PAS domain S-box-containing protein